VPPKTVLLLSAAPMGRAPLRVQAEEREIREQIRSSGRQTLKVVTSAATRPRDIHRAFLDLRPQIVHFSGHGGANGLILENDAGNQKPVNGEALADLFCMFTAQYPIECVVLNACSSEAQAREIARCVNYVIGVIGDISDRAAIEFSVGFYGGLAAEESYEFSYQLGCNAMRLIDLPDAASSLLLSGLREAKGEDAGVVKNEERSPVGDLHKLEGLLRSGWWKEADRETTAVLLKVVGRDEGDWVRDQELELFPCEGLYSIDALWSQYSKGRFGIKAQSAIWHRLGGLGVHPRGDGDLERRFGDAVGWRRNEQWLDYHSYTFDMSAPAGHLPRDFCRHASGWWLGRSCLLSTRLVICDAARWR
jgi:hypothetical protein